MFRALDKWLLPYLLRKNRGADKDISHLVIAVCDHFEPFHHTDKNGALERVARWRADFPKIATRFTDSDGQPPKHTFFYPIEQYDADVVAGIAEICRQTGSEGGIHLHHESDNAASLMTALEEGRNRLASHALLAEDGGFPFIHGDWALDNSHPQGRHCGVSGELGVLRAAGCLGDFTMPSAPSPTQTRTINSIYYATSSPRPKSHDRGVPAGPETRSFRDDPTKLLLVQGPLGFRWGRRKFGLLPRIENADLTGANPPTPDRLAAWLGLAPRLGQRPDVVFVKLHTHGAIEPNSGMLLGRPMEQFHQLLSTAEANYHYATAREMVNMIHAFEDGETGPPGDYRDYRFRRPTP